MAGTNAFLEARDLLLRLRGDQAAAQREFRWPTLDEFNWALDHFDALARDHDATGLWIVNEDGSEQRRSFRELSERSSQVANHLRTLGVRRGDRVLLMLGNELALWEAMLALIKLGAVMIPATALLTTEDLRDRMERGEVRHVIAASAQVGKFEPLAGDYTRIAVGEAQPGWHRFSDAAAAAAGFRPDGPTRATDPLLLYFTSGTTSKPKLVLHTHQSYPVGHLSTMYWIGLQPGDIHLNISSPGWAKHAWSCFFAPWNAGACVFIYNSARFDPAGLLATLERCRVTSLCAPPTVWRMLIQQDLAAYRGRLALRELVGAGEPLNPEILEQVRAAWGLTLRDGYGQTETTCQVGNAPGQRLKPGSMGRPLPGYRIVLLDADGREAEEGEVCIDLAERQMRDGVPPWFQWQIIGNSWASRGRWDSALVAMDLSSCGLPFTSGRNTEGSTRPANAVVTGDWWASRCGLNPAPRSSTATTTWLGRGAAVGGGGAGAGAAGGVQAVSSTASTATTSAAGRPHAPPTVTRTSRPGGVPNHTPGERVSADGGSAGISWSGPGRGRGPAGASRARSCGSARSPG